MPSELKTTVTELGDSRVRVEVLVAPEELEGSIERKARELGAGLRMPGFRRGKVPTQILIQRLGRETVLEEAVRDGISRWYADAIERSGIVPVGDPQLHLGELPPRGQALSFSIEIGVLPRAQLGAYRGVEAPRREPQAPEEDVDAEVERLRERLARLETVERPAQAGDFVVIDYRGFFPAAGREHARGAHAGGARAGGEAQVEGGGQPPPRGKPIAGAQARDQLVELGGGELIPGFEDALVGAGAGERRTFALTFPERYSNEELAGREVIFEVTVKEVKRSELPELDEDFALDAGFDDLEQLRGEIRERILEADRAVVEAEFRQAALDAVVAGARVDLTPELVKARAREMWERMLHSLSHRGISREAYLRVSGRQEQDVIDELEPEAELALRREAVITAIVEAEQIEVTDSDLLDALAPSAARENVEPEELLEQMRRSGRIEDLREDLAARRAIDVIAAEATPIEPARAQAREKLWTPEKAAEEERAPARAAELPPRLWTPDR